MVEKFLGFNFYAERFRAIGGLAAPLEERSLGCVKDMRRRSVPMRRVNAQLTLSV